MTNVLLNIRFSCIKNKQVGFSFRAAAIFSREHSQSAFIGNMLAGVCCAFEECHQRVCGAGSAYFSTEATRRTESWILLRQLHLCVFLASAAMSSSCATRTPHWCVELPPHPRWQMASCVAGTASRCQGLSSQWPVERNPWRLHIHIFFFFINIIIIFLKRAFQQKSVQVPPGTDGKHEHCESRSSQVEGAFADSNAEETKRKWGKKIILCLQEEEKKNIECLNEGSHHSSSWKRVESMHVLKWNYNQI